MDRSLLNRATAADDVPTPGYLYNEIAAITFISPEASRMLEEYLLKRLSRSDNANVLLKTLRVIKHVCEKGKVDFRRSIQRKADQIRVFQSFRAKPDPLRGEQPSRSVRQEAEACIKALFETENCAPVTSLEATSRIEGFGNETTSAATGLQNAFYPRRNSSEMPSQASVDGYLRPALVSQNGASRGRMEGFGNPYFDHGSSDPRRSATGILSSKSEQAVKYLSDAANRYMPQSVKEQLDKLGIQVPSVSSTQMPQPTDYYSGRSRFDDSTPGYAVFPRGNSFTADSQVPGGALRPGMNNPIERGGASYNSVWTAASSGEFESKLVEDLCAPGGAKIAPPRHVLDEFVGRCASLDPELIARLLIAKLDSDNTRARGEGWQQQLRVLYTLEALLQSPSTRRDGLLAAYLTAHAMPAISELRQVAQCASKAELVLRLLRASAGEGDGQQNSDAEADSAGLCARRDQAPSFDLLLDMEEDTHSDVLGIFDKCSSPNLANSKTASTSAPEAPRSPPLLPEFFSSADDDTRPQPPWQCQPASGSVGSHPGVPSGAPRVDLISRNTAQLQQVPSAPSAEDSTMTLLEVLNLEDGNSRGALAQENCSARGDGGAGTLFESLNVKSAAGPTASVACRTWQATSSASSSVVSSASLSSAGLTGSSQTRAASGATPTFSADPTQLANAGLNFFSTDDAAQHSSANVASARVAKLDHLFGRRTTSTSSGGPNTGAPSSSGAPGGLSPDPLARTCALRGGGVSSLVGYAALYPESTVSMMAAANSLYPPPQSFVAGSTVPTRQQQVLPAPAVGSLGAGNNNSGIIFEKNFSPSNFGLETSFSPTLPSQTTETFSGKECSFSRDNSPHKQQVPQHPAAVGNGVKSGFHLREADYKSSSSTYKKPDVFSFVNDHIQALR